MDGVVPGTTLNDRYRLDERLQSDERSSFWRAFDTTLEREVGVRVVRGDTAEETLDAARRAAMVEDARLLRVLDVGTEDDAAPLTYVVSEFVGAESLATALRERGRMRADELRAVVGEAAQALERARRAGLHHRCLTPHSLLRTPDGKVKVAGLAVDAAAAGIPDVDDVTAARQDAVALVGVLYAGLTDRWPVAGTTVPGLDPAPVVAEQPIPPADLVAGVPNDLDTLCAVTFGPHDDGPRTPGELADQLAPWGKDRTAAGPDDKDDDTHVGQRSGETMRPAGRFPVPLAGDSRPQEQERTPAQTTKQTVTPAPTQAQTLGQATRTMAVTAPARSAARFTPPPAPPGSDTRDHAAEEGGDRGSDRDDLTFAQAIGTGDYADPPRGASNVQKLILGAVALLVIVGLVLAVNSLAGIGKRGDAETASAPSSTASAQAPTTEPQPSTPSQSPTTEAAGPKPEIAGISTLDPQGDDGENDSDVPDAIDGDAGTWWPSSTYKTQDFGGLKDGVGVVVELAEKSTVNSVTLGFHGSGGAFELRSAPDVGLGGSTVIGSGSVTGESVEVKLAKPAETKYVVIWFTKLPEVGGEWRIELTEVSVA
ncbi:MAG TPA: hypothetical protein VFX33_15730 [Actinomycetales bacterium]|nr:hypothetical protein [Actinomycetales bacterium]